MGKKKLTTEEILKAARAQAAGSSKPPESESPAAETPSETSEGEAAPAPNPAAAKPAAPKAGGGPKSTADILAAARAQAGGGKPAEPKAAPAAKPAAAKPASGAKSTADILAAARAQAGGGGGAAAETAAAKPAAKSKPAAKAAPKPAGDRPSVQDMLKAVREGKPAEAGDGEAGKPKLPERPQKPPVATKPRAPEPARRNLVMMILLAPLALFANAFVAAWTLFTAAVAAFTLALARFMMPNVLVEPPSKFKIGPPSDYPLGTASTKWTAQFQVWIVHVMYEGKNEIYALSTVCTHLGCTPNWLEGEQKFKCPCHGSGFYITGINFEGPAPRPLERHGIRIAEDGMLEVDKSVKFQQEMGQWNDPASFVAVT